jgi:hypothetical protein
MLAEEVERRSTEPPNRVFSFMAARYAGDTFSNSSWERGESKRGWGQP